MLKRIATATVLIAIVLGTLLGLRQVSLYFADALALLVLALGMYETTVALRAAEYRPFAFPLIAGAVLVYPLVLLFGAAGILIALFVVNLLAIGYLTFGEYELRDMFATSFVSVYPMGLFATFFIINHSQIGMLAILWMLLVPVLTDTFAYFVGITFKGPKLCPNISPKKTVSGAIGGVIGGIVGSVLVFVLFDLTGAMGVFRNVGAQSLGEILGATNALITYILVGLVGGLICEIGDLGASRIKRKAGIKDFGNIFPGHGGMMDRLDSILFFMPIVFFMVALVERVSA